MSITILHGEHHANSRAALVELMDKERAKGSQIIRIEATASLQPAQLESELGSQDLFAQPKLIVIEELHSLPRSKKKDTLVELLLSYPDAQIVLWESKKLTAPQAKKLVSAKQQLFTLSSSLFEWLDSLHGPLPKKLSLLQQALQSDGAEFCFAMLSRQIRLLLITKSGEPMKEHPFVVKKLQQQARSFTQEQLLQFHEQLVLLDYRQKTGQSKLTLDQELEQLMLKK
jgi:DNA polymerase III delta subunit